jgi:hypothetical protein
VSFRLASGALHRARRKTPDARRQEYHIVSLAPDFDSTVRDFDAFLFFWSEKLAKITHGGIKWRTDRNGRRFGRRMPVRTRGGKPARRAGWECVNCWKSVGNAKTGPKPLDTGVVLLYSRPHRNPPWRGPHPATPKKVSKTVNVLPRNRVYGSEGPQTPHAKSATSAKKGNTQ